MTKNSKFYAIVIEAIVTGKDLETSTSIREIEQIAVSLLADGWKMVPMVIEVRENFYNVIFVMPTYIDDVIVADITMLNTHEYVVSHLSEVKKCIVSKDKLSRLTNNLQTNIFGNNIEE